MCIFELNPKFGVDGPFVVAFSNPLAEESALPSRSMLIIRSQPSLIPRFSAAMAGWRIQFCSRATASSWRFAISAWKGFQSTVSAASGEVDDASAAAARVPCIKLRRVRGVMIGLIMMTDRPDCNSPRYTRLVPMRCAWAGQDPLMIDYHDREWGVPLHDDAALFEFLILEGAQAGLSWSTILKKRPAYRKAFDRFNPRKVARYAFIQAPAR